MYIKSPIKFSLVSSTTLAAIALALLSTSPAHGATIISDGFSEANGTALSGLTPDIKDLPGSTYTAHSQSTASSVNSGAATLSTNASGFISIASNGTYTKPTAITISGDLTLGSVQTEAPRTFGDNTVIRGLGLGFDSNSTSDGDPKGNFTGLMLSPTGSLALEVGGGDFVSTASLETVSYNAADFNNVAFNPSTSYTLSYVINTTTGAISGVTLTDSNGSQSYNFTTSAFTDTVTENAGFYLSASNSGGTGTVDNFSVTGPLAATPEPSTWALFLMGSLGLFGWQRFRRTA